MSEMVPEQEPEEPEELDADQAAQVAAMLQQRMGMSGQGWRPACTSCLNMHKLAIMEISEKLIKAGMQPGSPEFAQAMQTAMAWGQQLAQNPMAIQGLNGTKPDIIPPVRSADIMVNGTSCCAFCFQAGKQTSLIAAPASWAPRLGG